MKITKKQLRKIISENVGFAPMRSRANPYIVQAVENSRRQEQLREANPPRPWDDRVKTEAQLMERLNNILHEIGEWNNELYGLVDEDGVDQGSEYAKQIQLKLDEANDFFNSLVDYFEKFDDRPAIE